MRGLSLVTILLVSALLAGCVGGDDSPAKSTTPEAPDEAGPVEKASGKGTVKGQVFGADNLEPQGGAEVNLVSNAGGDGYKAVVARTGDYVINGVEPGRYSIIVFSVGYTQGARAIDVIADAVQTVNFQLEPLPSDEPYMTWEPIAGFLPYSTRWQVEVMGECIVEESPPPTPTATVKSCSGTASASGDDNQEIAVNITNDTKTIVLEMVWEPKGPLGEYLQLDFMCKDVPRASSGAVVDPWHPCYFDEGDFQSPVMYRIDEEHWLEHGYNFTGNWAARVFAGYGMLGTYELTGIDVGAAYQQDFTYYVSVFHKEPAPEGYSGIPDA